MGLDSMRIAFHAYLPRNKFAAYGHPQATSVAGQHTYFESADIWQLAQANLRLFTDSASQERLDLVRLDRSDTIVVQFAYWPSGSGPSLCFIKIGISAD